MKTTFNIKFLSIVIIFLGFAAVANAQNTATATASATVVEGSSVTKDQDLNFGSLIKGNTTGTVHIAPNGQMTYSGITAPRVPATLRRRLSLPLEGQPAPAFLSPLPLHLL